MVRPSVPSAPAQGHGPGCDPPPAPPAGAADAMMTEYLDRVDSYLSNSLTEPGAVGHITMVRSYTRRLFTRGAALLNVCMVCIRDGHE